MTFSTIMKRRTRKATCLLYRELRLCFVTRLSEFRWSAIQTSTSRIPTRRAKGEKRRNTSQQTEIDLLANLMYEGYLKRDVSKLRAFQHQYTPSDLQVFSPANDRKTFMAMYNTVVEENKVKLDRYMRKDRRTGQQKTIDYTSYETEES